MCQANKGKLTFLQGSGGLRKLQNMYLHSLPAMCEPQDFQFTHFTTWIFFLQIQILKKVRMWSGSGNHKVSKFENTENLKRLFVLLSLDDKSHF